MSDGSADTVSQAVDSSLVWLEGFFASWVVSVGRGLGLLDELAGRPHSSESLASTLGLYAPAVSQWCAAATAFGILNRSSSSYSLVPGMREVLLDADHPSFYGANFNYLVEGSLDFDQLEDYFRSGSQVLNRSPRFARNLGEVTRIDLCAFEHVLPELLEHTHDALRQGPVLEVGCGTGDWSVAQARRFPEARFVGIDINQAAIDLARSEIAREGLESMVGFEVADLHLWRSRARFRFAYLQETLSCLPQPEDALARLYELLQPGGWLAVLEWPLPDSTKARDSRHGRLMWMYQFHEMARGVNFFTKDTLESCIRAAGFEHPIRLESGLGAVVIIAVRESLP